MFIERTSVGLDVHARSVAAAAIDGVTGELLQTRLTPAHDHIREWCQGLAGPVAVAYEAGQTGFGLSRSLTAAGIRCEVVAPSKLQRPAGDRVKTDAKDAVHLARLLRLDEVTSVARAGSRPGPGAGPGGLSRGPGADPASAVEAVAAARDRLLRRACLDRHARRLATARSTAAAHQPVDPADVRLQLRDRVGGQDPPRPAGRRDRGQGRSE
ncbi:IS110 family transposase [Actinophytocola sp.]|uniref:IS110 family transposase n=1 Tax=Actinophytocola sp. TaxID=1872138 RepID=UPI003D6B4AC2